MVDVVKNILTPSISVSLEEPVVQRSPHNGIPAAISRLASDFVNTVPTDQNFVFSPFSIHAAMSMVLFGARGETGQELISALHLSSLAAESIDSAREKFKNTFALDRSGMKQRQDIWLDRNTSFHQSYIDVVSEVFRASTGVLDFSDAKAVADHINNEVNMFTNGKVPVLLSVQDIQSIQGFFPAILTNMLFHKGSWEQSFRPENTHEAQFYTHSHLSRPTTFMESKGTYKYMKVPGATFLVLPYADSDSFFVCVLPENTGVWPDLSCTYRIVLRMDWKNAVANMKPVDDMKVILPKFRMTQPPISIAPKLKELGVLKAFDGNAADFSAMTPAPKYCVSDVLHAAGIEINEEGSEAGAATAVMMRSLCLETKPKEFVANRPFLFFIVGGDGAVYFSGRLCDPSGSECR